MDSEDETRRLLKIREDLETRIGQLRAEVEDLRRAVAEIDRHIVRQGFRQPIPAPARPGPSVGEESLDKDQSSVKSRDGTVLGSLRVCEDEVVFEPREELGFTTAIPPFQSFLIERVLSNMRSTDESRAATGEIQPEGILSFDVSTEGDRILRVVVRNYGEERRLREIQSSLRWAFDKMYEKLRQG